MSALDEMLVSLRTLGNPAEVERRVAKKAEWSLQTALERTLAAGETPEGKAWQPRKAGGRPYEHAASRIRTKASGNLVRTTLSGPEVFGHFGARGMPVRQMLPDAGAGMPPSVDEALTKAARAVFEEAVA